MVGFVILSPQKPARSDPCNGCGQCCQNVTCPTLDKLLPNLASEYGPCPVLEWDGSKYRCGLVQNPSRYLGTLACLNYILTPLIMFLIETGVGCSSPDPAVTR